MNLINVRANTCCILPVEFSVEGRTIKQQNVFCEKNNAGIDWIGSGAS